MVSATAGESGVHRLKTTVVGGMVDFRGRGRESFSGNYRSKWTIVARKRLPTPFAARATDIIPSCGSRRRTAGVSLHCRRRTRRRFQWFRQHRGCLQLSDDHPVAASGTVGHVEVAEYPLALDRDVEDPLAGFDHTEFGEM
jgi:hypothetical protein